MPSFESQPIYTCNNRQSDGKNNEEFDWLPVYAGDLSKTNSKVSYSGHCFSDITMSYEQTSDSSFDLEIDL